MKQAPANAPGPACKFELWCRGADSNRRHMDFQSIASGPIIALLDDRISRGFSEQTIKFDRDYLERLQIGLLSPLLVTTKTQMRTLLSDLTCTPGGKHASLRAARTFFNWAVEEQYIAVSPCKNLSVKVPNVDRYTLSVEQIRRLGEACDTEIQRVVVMLLADTGIRRSELASIQIDDLDMATQRIRIVGKANIRRTVRFWDFTAAHVKTWIRTRSTDEECQEFRRYWSH